MTAPGPDWIEQARRFAAGLAAQHTDNGLTDLLGGLLAGPAGTSADHPTGTSAGNAADHSAECRRCPLCAGLAALRGQRPDLVEALADVLTGAATALRTTADTSRADAPAPDAPAPDAPAPDAPAPDAPAPDASAPDASAPDTPADGDVTTAPEETVPHPAPAPTVQRIHVA